MRDEKAIRWLTAPFSHSRSSRVDGRGTSIERARTHGFEIVIECVFPLMARPFRGPDTAFRAQRPSCATTHWAPQLHQQCKLDDIFVDPFTDPVDVARFDLSRQARGRRRRCRTAAVEAYVRIPR